VSKQKVATSRKKSVTAALAKPKTKAKATKGSSHQPLALAAPKGPVKVKTKVKADSQEFCPLATGTTVQLLANIPSPPDLKAQPGYVHRIGLGPRATAVVDCGIEVTIPDGFKAVAHLEPSLAGKGLLIDGNVYSGTARIAFRVRNVGREIIPVLHKDRVASLSLEPVYLFDFTE